jgi:hypothetical protein
LESIEAGLAPVRAADSEPFFLEIGPEDGRDGVEAACFFLI